MIDSEFCLKCGRPYAIESIGYCDPCIKDMEFNNKRIRDYEINPSEKADLEVE